MEQPDAVLSPLSPGEALLNAVPASSDSECPSVRTVWFASPLEQPAGAQRPLTPASQVPARRKRKASLTKPFSEFLQSLTRSDSGDSQKDSESESRLTRVDQSAGLSDGGWPSPRSGLPSPRSAFLTDSEPPSGSRSLAHSSGDERSEKPSRRSVRQACISIVQHPRGSVFRKDARYSAPFTLQIELPPGSSHSGEMHARMISDAGKSTTTLSSVPTISVPAAKEGTAPAIKLLATFDGLRLSCGTHNQTAHLVFEINYTDPSGTQHALVSPPSEPFIVCTHSTQLVSAAALLLRSATFLTRSSLSWSAFGAIIRAHFSNAALVSRVLADTDLDYLHERLGRPDSVTLADLNKLWTWLGVVLKVVLSRRGKLMWESGLLCGLVPVDRTLTSVPPGTAAIGFNPSNGELISHVTPCGGGVQRTITERGRRCIVDEIIVDAAADRIWVVTQRTAISKSDAAFLAGLSPRRPKPGAASDSE